MFTPLPCAFLGYPAMLWWGLAAAAPLIIHLLSKRKYREVQWAAMHYLLAALRKNSRRILLEQWLLMVIRTLAIALLVLAVAQPGCEQSGLRLGGGGRTHKVLVIDGSYSMAYKPEDKSRFDRAKELATRIVDEASPGDGFTLLLMSAPPRVVVGTPALDARDFREEIKNLRLPHGGGDLAATLERVEQVLEAARRDHPRLAREEIFFLTDLGRTSWSPELRGAAAEEFLARSTRLGNAASMLVIDLGQADSENLAITHVAASEPFATTARDVALEAELRNFGAQPQPRQLVELFVDNRRVGEEYVDLEAGGRATASFAYRFDTPGDHLVEVRLAKDLLEIDNHRWLAVGVKENLRVLCIDGKPSGTAFRGAADYLRVALAPGTEKSDRALVQVDVAAESAVLERDLAAYDAVFLANVGQFTASEAAVLAAYLKHGGGLVWFLGDQVQAENYNRRLAARPAADRVLPARLLETSAPGQYSFHPLGYQHPLLAPFRDQEQGGLVTTPIQQYIRLQVVEDSRAKVVLGFDSGDPAIVEEPLGRGRSILVATSADISWTAMPMWPSYLPLVQELLAWSVRGQFADRNLQVGQALGDSLRNAGNLTTVSVRNPSGESLAVRLRPEGDYTAWSFTDTLASGAYVATLGPPLSRTQTFAVNVDPAESDLTKVQPADLRSLVWPGVRFEQRTDLQDLSREPTESLVRRSKLDHLLLVAVLGLLLSETLLAWSFGRRAQ